MRRAHATVRHETVFMKLSNLVHGFANTVSYLQKTTPSPVVALNRAARVSKRSRDTMVNF